MSLISRRWRKLNLLKHGLITTVILFFSLGLFSERVSASSATLDSTALLERGETSHERSFNSSDEDGQSWVYTTQSGDTLEVIAKRFEVRVSDIDLYTQVPIDSLLDPGLELIIRRSGSVPASFGKLLPDSEVVYSPSAAGFNPRDYVQSADGFLSSYHEYMRSTGTTPAVDIITRVAVENSIHPRLLLALVEFQCGCVSGPLEIGLDEKNLMRIQDPSRRGLYRQLGWTVNQLSLGYYGWRQGLLHNLVLSDGSVITLSPELNAGSVALAYLFSQLLDSDRWYQAMDPGQGFMALYWDLYPDARKLDLNGEELYPPGLSQPDMILPFELNEEWSFTSGPHQAWETEAALAALDFAPASERFGCLPSSAWVLAAADGLVVRSEHNALVLDLDGDGFEGTGWTLLYMHVADYQRAAEGTYLKRGDRIGHPSCEGGPADGTHVHLARKYNGEWIAAGGPLPFLMSGWTAREGFKPYEGSLVREGQIVQANSLSPANSFIIRTDGDFWREARISREMWWEE